MADHNVPVISQRTINLCWEACGHMMWDWKYQKDKANRAQYASQAGQYARMNAGLSGMQCDPYYRQLGMHSTLNASGINIRNALTWSPVVITSVSRVKGHVMIAIGHNSGKYSIINPCAALAVNFESSSAGSCIGGSSKLPETKIDQELGHYIWYW